MKTETINPNETARAAGHLTSWLGSAPALAFVLGSGWAGIEAEVADKRELSYLSIPGFLPTCVHGHSGKIISGFISGIPILLLSGRFHYYEGHSMEQVVFPMRVLAAIGIKTVCLTNAAGGINPAYRPGDFMVFSDHINFIGTNPLRGLGKYGPCGFVDLTSLYSARLQASLVSSAQKHNLSIHRGIYLGVSGPSYETPAEIRAFRTLGADVVGMSTIPEAIVAHQLGLEVCALSCITNLAAGLSSQEISHQEVLQKSNATEPAMRALLKEFVMQAFPAATKT